MALKPKIQALIDYANETTEAGDVTLGDCVKTLADGYNGGANVPSSPLVIPSGEMSAKLAALLAYSNEVTGAGDTRMGDAIRTLCEGYGAPIEILTYLEITGSQSAAIVINELPLPRVAYPIYDITMYRGTSNPSNYPLISMYKTSSISVGNSSAMVGKRGNAANTEVWTEQAAFSNNNRYVGVRLQTTQTKGYGLYLSASSSSVPTTRRTRGSMTSTASGSSVGDNSLAIFYDWETSSAKLNKGTRLYGVKVWYAVSSHAYNVLIPESSLELMYDFVPARRGSVLGLYERKTNTFFPTTHGAWVGV